MIEVEKKFILDDKDKRRLTKDASFLNERAFTDIYYDTKFFFLTSNNKWLRSRDGKFELKISLNDGISKLSEDQYDELEDEQKIREALNLPSNGNLANDLIKAEYFPFCTCRTTRRKYQKESFIIDFDTVDFQDFTYDIAEIELMVNGKSEIEEAIEKIMAFAKEQELTIVPVRGKVVEYLKRVKPDHYQALIDSGVVKSS